MRKAVMLSLDAMDEHDLAHFGEGRALRRLMDESAVCTQVKTVFPALTYPAHTTLVTGCDPALHGVGHNQPLQPDTPSDMRAWYWDAADVKRETLFDAVHGAGGRCCSVLWPVSGRNPAVRWLFPEVLALPGENQVLKMLRYGSPLWLLEMEARYGRIRRGASEPYLSDYAAAIVSDAVHRHRPDLTCAHLVDLDETRHHFGTDSQEAAAALDRHEKRVTQVLDAMQGTRGMEDALLILVSDHGQADVSRTVVLEDTLRMLGAQGVTVQSSGMSAYLFGDADALARAARCLSAHAQEAGVQRVYTRAELDAMGCVPQPGLAVEAAPGVVFADRLHKEKRERATHGFGPGHSAENCLFAVYGRGVRRGARLDSMPMRDVAPTVAALMGVPLSRAQGRDHSADILRGDAQCF